MFVKLTFEESQRFKSLRLLTFSFSSDQQKPTITYCTENIYQAISGSEASVTWTEPSFTDNVEVVRVTSTKKPGDTFQIGSLTVLYEAFDAAGNKEGCSFIVQLTRESLKA